MFAAHFHVLVEERDRDEISAKKEKFRVCEAENTGQSSASSVSKRKSREHVEVVRGCEFDFNANLKKMGQ